MGGTLCVYRDGRGRGRSSAGVGGAAGHGLRSGDGDADGRSGVHGGGGGGGYIRGVAGQESGCVRSDQCGHSPGGVDVAGGGAGYFIGRGGGRRPRDALLAERAGQPVLRRFRPVAGLRTRRSAAGLRHDRSCLRGFGTARASGHGAPGDSLGPQSVGCRRARRAPQARRAGHRAGLIQVDAAASQRSPAVQGSSGQVQAALRRRGRLGAQRTAPEWNAGNHLRRDRLQLRPREPARGARLLAAADIALPASAGQDPPAAGSLPRSTGS